MILNKIKTKKSKQAQSEIITTVLLVLISIGAVVLVSSFVINLIKSNLQGTDCFKTAGQLTINVEDGYTYFDGKDVYVNIDRSSEQFNLTGIIVSFSSGSTTKAYTIKTTGGSAEVKMFDNTPIALPKASESFTYNISGLGSAGKVKIVPIIAPDKTCKEGVDERDIPAR